MSCDPAHLRLQRPAVGATLASLFVVDRWGRRRLFIGGGLQASASLCRDRLGVEPHHQHTRGP